MVVVAVIEGVVRREGGRRGRGAPDRDTDLVVQSVSGPQRARLLEMALGHVPWHPNLSLARLHLALSK